MSSIESVALVVALEASRLPALLELDMLAVSASVCGIFEVCGPEPVLVELGEW